MPYRFTKMHSCGTSVVLMSSLVHPVANPHSLAVRLCEDIAGVGAQRFVLLCPSALAAAAVHCFYPDGHEAPLSGSALCSAAAFLLKNKNPKQLAALPLALETPAGVRYVMPQENGRFTMNLGQVECTAALMPALPQRTPCIDRLIEICGGGVRVTCVKLGVLHCVVPVENIHSLDVNAKGAQFAQSRLFAGGVQVNFVQKQSATQIQLRTWAHGTEQKASATGACAALAAQTIVGCLPQNTPVTCTMPGGTFCAEMQGSAAWLTGSAVEIFQGNIQL